MGWLVSQSQYHSTLIPFQFFLSQNLVPVFEYSPQLSTESGGVWAHHFGGGWRGYDSGDLSLYGGRPHRQCHSKCPPGSSRKGGGGGASSWRQPYLCHVKGSIEY